MIRVPFGGDEKFSFVFLLLSPESSVHMLNHRGKCVFFESHNKISRVTDGKVRQNPKNSAFMWNICVMLRKSRKMTGDNKLHLFLFSFG